MTLQELLVALQEDLDHYHSLAEDAIRRNDMDAHLVYGGQFHRTANRILHYTGSDPREQYAV